MTTATKTKTTTLTLTCQQSDLSEALNRVGRAVPSRPSHPILVNVLFNLSRELITLTAFDLSLCIQVTLEGSWDGDDHTVCLPSKLLNDIISRLPSGDVTLFFNEGETGSIDVLLKSASGKYKIQGQKADEFPELPTVEGESITLPTSILKQGLAHTLFTCSDDESKQVLTGVHLTLNESAEFTEFAATDGHRLSVMGALTDEAGTEATIPAKSLREVERILDGDTIQFTLSNYQAVFKGNSATVTTRVLEGQYPNYSQLIPKSFSKAATLNREQLLKSLDRISVLADQKNNVVKLSFTSGTLELSVEAQDVGSGREELSCEGDFQLDIAFNVKYLMDGLKACNSTEIELNMNTSTSPAVIEPINAGCYLYLLMPVQIRGN